MTPASSAHEQLSAENAELRVRLEEAQDTLRAIRGGEVDALLVETADGPRIFTLQGLDAESSRLRGEILAQVSDCVIAVDADQRMTYLNAAAERQYRFCASDALGRPLRDIFTWQWPRAEMEAAMWAALRAHGEWRSEITHRTHDGREIAVETSLTALRDAGGAPAGYAGVFRDISERHRAQTALLESDERYRRVIETAHEGIWTIDAQGLTTYVNQRIADLLGYAPAELMGRVHTDFMWEEDRPKAGVNLGLHRQGLPQVGDQRYRRKDGSELWTVASYNAMFDPDGEFIGALGMFTDITERKRVEESLWESEDRLRLAAEAMDMGIWDLDLATNVAIRTLRHDQIFGYETLQPLWSLDTALKHIVPEDRPAILEAYALAQSTNKLFHESRVRWPDGSIHWISVRGKMRYDAQGKPLRIAGIVTDITERKRAEEALRDSEASYRSLFENMLDGYAYCQMLFDEHGQPHDFVYLAVNDSFGRLTGLENVTGKKVTQVPGIKDLNPELFEAYVRVALTGIPERFEIDFKPLGLRLSMSVYCPMKGHFVAVFDDITQRTQTEEALRESEQRFRIMADGLPLVIWVHDAQGRLQFVNRTYCEFFGVTPLQIAGTSWEPLVHSDDVAAYAGEFSACVQGRRPFHAEVRARRFDGEWRWLESRANPRFSACGEFLGMVGSSPDITERRQAEDALRESQQFTFSVLDNLFSFVGVMTMDGTLTYANAAPLQAASIPAGEGLGEKFWDCYWWSYSPEIQAQLRQACARAANGEIVRYDVLVRMAGDTRVWIDFQVAPLRNAHGRITHLVPSAMEIDMRRAAEEKLRASETRTRLATEATAVGIWEWNVLTNAICWDAQMFRLYGIAPTADGFVHYTDWSGAVLPQDLPENERILQDSVQHGGKSHREFRIRRRDDGAVRHIEAVQTVRANAQNETEWVVGTNLDVTERSTAEIRLRQLTAELTEADRRKDEFLATLAHELRNPLVPIRNGLRLMKMADVPAATVEQTRSMIDRQLTHMVRLIDDLMDVSRITRGKLVLRKEHVPIAAVVDSAVEAVRPLVEQMGQQLTVTLPQQPLMVDADLTRLAQVFVNLLNNAAKYSAPGGHIQLSVECQRSDVVVTVKDTGIGIAADQLPRIFEMFTQVDRSMEMSQGGLGIGLTLVHRLLEMHGGRIEAMSDGPGQGSQFVVHLPLVVEASQPRQSAAAAEYSARSPLRILVVDDNRDGADSLSELLTMMGDDTRTAYDGQAALDAAMEFQPDVILLDIGLPKLNGYEVCRRIRRQPDGENIVLIAVTGWGQDEDRRRSHAAGFDHHMVKPVDPQALLELLEGLDVRHKADARWQNHRAHTAKRH